MLLLLFFFSNCCGSRRNYFFFLYSTWLVFLCSSRGLNYVHSANYQLSEKLGAALIVKGECGAETIADYNSKTMEYIPLNVFPSTYSPQHIPLDLVVNSKEDKINKLCTILRGVFNGLALQLDRFLPKSNWL